MVRKFVRHWWNGLIYDPSDPRHLSGGKIRIVALGGGTGLSNLLRGLKRYTSNLVAIEKALGAPLDSCLVNSRILRQAKTPSRLGAINNITTHAKNFGACRVIRGDVISTRNPLYHDPEKLSRALIKLYRHR